MVSTWMAVVVIVALLAGAVLLQYSIDEGRRTREGWDDSAPFDTTRSFLDLLGGMRESLAASLWLKTDALFHQYFGASIRGEQALFPYFWLITRLDPRFTMAQYYTSWMLARFGRVDQGYDLALEGVRNNPDSALLQSNLALIYFFFKRDPLKARYHMLKALEFSEDEEDRQVYGNFLKTIDKVIAGEKEIPDPPPLEASEHFEHRHHEHE
jgi:tetratricopeptide (TPR) repeat protein